MLICIFGSEKQSIAVFGYLKNNMVDYKMFNLP